MPRSIFRRFFSSNVSSALLTRFPDGSSIGIFGRPLEKLAQRVGVEAQEIPVVYANLPPSGECLAII